MTKRYLLTYFRRHIKQLESLESQSFLVLGGSPYWHRGAYRSILRPSWTSPTLSCASVCCRCGTVFDITGNDFHCSRYKWSHGKPLGGSADKRSNDGRCCRFDHGPDHIESRRRLFIQRDHSHSASVCLDRVRGIGSSDLSLRCKAHRAGRKQPIAATTKCQVQGRLLLLQSLVRVPDGHIVGNDHGRDICWNFESVCRISGGRIDNMVRWLSCGPQT
jgi:hypothetical protein